MKKYIIDNEVFTEARAAADYITEQMDEEVFDDMLDECYEEVQICGLSYSPSYALYSIDKVAYKEAMYEYYDSLASDMEYTIERMDDGEEEDFYGCTVQCVDDDTEAV